MALETWLVKVKKTIAQRLDSAPSKKKPPIKKPNVAVLAFEIAGLMSKLLHLWHSLSDKNIARIRADSICLEGVRKIVSNDETFLLSLACAEFVDNLKSLARSISRITNDCSDPALQSFDRLWPDFANSGQDPNNWLLGPKELEPKFKKMDQIVLATATLHREMDQLVELEHALKKLFHTKKEEQKLMIELQHKILWQRQEIKYLKVKSLWSRSFDSVASLLVRSVFTTLARIKLVFGVNQRSRLSSVYPSENQSPNQDGFFELNSKTLEPPSTTLGAVALSLHYSNLIIVMEKMIRSPQLVGLDARDDLYSMLPNSVRFALRARLKGVGFSASDPVLAAEWRDALQRILGWLSPLAHNMIKWQGERSFEQQQNMVPKTNVLLLQTLYFANQEKTEAAITELLVGLNYIWRFEREMNAKAMFFQCSSNFNGYLNSQYPS